MSLSARNRLSGTVRRVETDGLTAEVTIELDGGQTVTATVTSSAADRLWLARGDEVDAVVQASSVMIDAGSEDG